MSEEEVAFQPDYQKLDPENMRQAILDMPSHVEQGYRLAEALDLGKLKHKHTAVIIAGMGGSAIAGLLLRNYLTGEKLQVTVVQDYELPQWAGDHTLVIACSYSGNTEETLSVFKEARRKECDIIAVTTGGKLEEYTKISKIPTLIIPTGFQPRAALAIQFFAMLRILEKLKLVESKAGEVLRLKEELKKQIPAIEQNAIIISQKLTSKIPIIYSSNKFNAVSYRWKCQFNENSKIMAFCNVFSELNHNEMEGFENEGHHYHAIFLKFNEDHRRIQRRMSLTKEIMLRKGISATEIGIRGNSLLSKLFSAIILGDLASYYLALRRGVNPSKVHVIEDFKTDLGPYVA